MLAQHFAKTAQNAMSNLGIDLNRFKLIYIKSGLDSRFRIQDSRPNFFPRES